MPLSPEVLERNHTTFGFENVSTSGSVVDTAVIVGGSSNDLSSASQTSLNASESSISAAVAANSGLLKWGDIVSVELCRDQTKGFGISIIGGRDSQQTPGPLLGILIKKILPDSPALKCGLLKTGDKLLEVGGVDLRNFTHDEAVEVIKNAKSPVRFVVQSLIPIVSSQKITVPSLFNDCYFFSVITIICSFFLILFSLAGKLLFFGINYLFFIVLF